MFYNQNNFDSLRTNKQFSRDKQQQHNTNNFCFYIFIFQLFNYTNLIQNENVGVQYKIRAYGILGTIRMSNNH